MAAAHVSLCLASAARALRPPLPLPIRLAHSILLGGLALSVLPCSLVLRTLSCLGCSLSCLECSLSCLGCSLSCLRTLSCLASLSCHSRGLGTLLTHLLLASDLQSLKPRVPPHQSLKPSRMHSTPARGTKRAKEKSETKHKHPRPHAHAHTTPPKKKHHQQGCLPAASCDASVLQRLQRHKAPPRNAGPRPYSSPSLSLSSSGFFVSSLWGRAPGRG